MSAVCTSNLTSGFIDLATYDEQEKYLYGGPDSVAYFVREIRKATWFTTVPVCLSRSSGQPGFNQQWSVSISRAGDYLLQSWLRLTTPAITGNTFSGNAAVTAQWSVTGNYFTISATQQASVTILRWTKNFMHNLIYEANIAFNDLVAARFDSFHLDFWAAFTVPAGKRNGYNNMIGTVDSLINPVATLPGGIAGLGAAGLHQVLPSAVLNLPLPFFYARDTGLALPTAALPYNEMRINFSFRDWTDLLIADTINLTSSSGSITSGAWVSGAATTANIAGNAVPVLNNVQVWSNYAIVSNEERKKMACAPRDILIEQVQTAPIQSFVPNALNYNPSFDIRFSHAIKALFWSVRNKTILPARSNYTTALQAPIGIAGRSAGDSSFGSSGANYALPTNFGIVDFNQGTDPIINTTLIYENTQRLYQMGSDYFSMVQPWYTAPVIPLDTGFHMYSYSLDFFCIDPMGSTNYGKLTNVSIQPMGSQDAYVSQLAAGSTAAAAIYPGYPTNVQNPNPLAYSTSANPTSYEFIVTCVNNNIIRISGGKPKGAFNSRLLKRCNISFSEKQCKILPYLLDKYITC